MTVENCISFCSNKDFIYAGLEYYQECYCGNYILNGGAETTASDCSFPCTGDSAEVCGAGNRLSMYWSGQSPPPAPEIVPSVGLWESLGCYIDNNGGRTLPNQVAVSDNTIENCVSACYNAGYVLAGAEYSDECWCGSSIGAGGAPAAASSCNMLCTGNNSEYCGGPNRLNLYNYTGTSPNKNSASGVQPVTGLPGNWTYNGCWIDNANGRVFTKQFDDNPTLTTLGCTQSCSALNYTIAGLEWSVQCMCGNYLVGGAVKEPDESTCNMGCGGSKTEECGGPNRLSVYSSTGNVTALPVAVPLKDNLPGQWKYVGCLAEPGAVRVFPNKMVNTNDNTVQGCLKRCSDYGFPAGGLEYGEECYCGDVEDIATNGGVMSPESDCNILCTGDPYHLCGGQQRLQLYEWNGNLNVWNQPQNTGRYEFLIGSPIVSLIATLGINNKVTFLEKWGTSVYPNSTGAYELDLTLVNDYTKTWREMHVKTDVFCAASIILPDKAGRQINVGGWSVDSLFGIRLYSPDGSPGVNGTNDWEEDVNVLALQRGRWYPTALLLTNGSILVVGGEHGSNGAAEPTLEILPKPAGGDTVVYLDWLNRTDPNNLYPFLHILPNNGNIFVIYWNEARILDKTTFETVKVLPNLPGSVISNIAGRNYPLSGASALLPQHYPYTDPLEVLFCGGSDILEYQRALDNCISIQPEATEPTWTIERMPSPRVMACMVTLPDGTFIILNGALVGVAGFGLASNPNMEALLYNPSLPVNQRISKLSSTIVARMYHSEAILLSDGRVLVSGSDPQTYYPNGTAIYPEEFRVEVYYPPYLTDGRIQPTYTITNTDWQYGQGYLITVNLAQGTTADMKVSLVAASSSTHGNLMGNRILFPQVTCAGNVCTVTAPPNVNVCPPGWYMLFVLDGPTPSHSQWVRIGGDPAGLGNWPSEAPFTPPGV